MTTLISFLGRYRRDPHKRSQHASYQQASYDLGDGQLPIRTAFFGSALMERLRPQRTILLGTAGSMWDVLDFDVESPEWAELVEATEQEAVTQHLLDRVSTRTRGVMSGAELMLIGYCRDQAEQLALLGGLAERIAEGERVVIDVTHGFRHLPMLALVAARYLGHVRRAEVTKIYYGAFDMTSAEGITPVLELDGLLRMLDWVEAFAAHDASGNYGVFAPLLGEDGLSAGASERLARAAHFERITNSPKARENITPLLADIGKLGGATRLFADQLVSRLGWTRKNGRDERERALFEAYLARQDFVRSAIYLQESAISAECIRSRLDGNDHSQREQARSSLKSNQAFRALSDIRNLLAHGTFDGSYSRRATAAAQATATASELDRRLRELAGEITREAL